MTTQRLDMVVDVVDSTDRVIGSAQRRHVLQQATGFRVAHVFLFKVTGEILLQQIASGRRHSGLWGSSVAGYLGTGETYQQAAERRTREELGVSPAVVEYGKTKMVDQSALKFIALFTGMCDGPFSPDAADVSYLEFVDIPRIMAERTAGSRLFTPTFLHLLDFYIQSLPAVP